MDENLFEPLSPDARAEFGNADGGELKAGSTPPKMHSMYSSSAAAANLCHYWRRLEWLSILAKAMRIGTSGLESLEFEAQLPVMDDSKNHGFEKDPNLDLVFRYGSRAKHRLIGVECKYTEPYPAGSKAIKEAYFSAPGLWKNLPACRRLAKQLTPKNRRFKHLDAAQLLKHLLGLRHAAESKGGFRLLYLWYDVPFRQGDLHRAEIEEFGEIVKKDGVSFQHTTYQEVIAKLARAHRDEHQAYVDYMVERYG